MQSTFTSQQILLVKICTIARLTNDSNLQPALWGCRTPCKHVFRPEAMCFVTEARDSGHFFWNMKTTHLQNLVNKLHSLICRSSARLTLTWSFHCLQTISHNCLYGRKVVSYGLTSLTSHAHRCQIKYTSYRETCAPESHWSVHCHVLQNQHWSGWNTKFLMRL